MMPTETKQKFAWAKTTLSDICSKITDGTHHSPINKTEGAFMYVTAKNIRRWGLDLTDITYVSEAVHNEIFSRCPVEQGDVLYIKDGVTTGIAAINTCSKPFSMLSSVALLKPIKKAIDSRFLKHWLNSPETLKSMTGNMTGSAIKRLVLKTIRKAEIQLPPLNEQRRIADKLDTTLAAVEACKQKLNNAAKTIQRFRQSVLAAAVSGELTREWREERGIEEEWEQVKTADICERIFDGPFGSNLKSDDYTTEGKQVVRLENIGRLKYKSNKKTYISDSKFSALEKHVLQKGDLLFSSFVTEETRTCLLPEELSGVAINKADVFCLRTNTKACLNEFALILFSSSRIYSKIEEQIHGATRPRINLKQLRSIELLLPSIAEQIAISKKVSELYEAADNAVSKLHACNQLLGDLVPATLAKAFRGELVPQDPNDEPASALLERIKAQREAEGTAKRPAKRGRKKKADAAQLTVPETIADNHLAKVIEECGALSELALLAASELQPGVFQLQLSKELKAGGLKQVDVGGEAAYADAAWEEEL